MVPELDMSPFPPQLFTDVLFWADKSKKKKGKGPFPLPSPDHGAQGEDSTLEGKTEGARDYPPLLIPPRGWSCYSGETGCIPHAQLLDCRTETPSGREKRYVRTGSSTTQLEVLCKKTEIMSESS